MMNKLKNWISRLARNPVMAEAQSGTPVPSDPKDDELVELSDRELPDMSAKFHSGTNTTTRLPSEARETPVPPSPSLSDPVEGAEDVVDQAVENESHRHPRAA